MAKQTKPPEKFADLVFPLHGIDNANEFDLQRPGTTPTGENVRAFEPLTGRGRGGARSGLLKYISSQVNGDSVIQLLDIIVDPTTDALLDDPDGPLLDFVDPSTSNRPHGRPRRIPAGQTRRVRTGGSGIQQNRNKPGIPLTITADDQAKAYGDAFIFTGTEFTSSGLQGSDSITFLSLRSTGAQVSAEAKTYDIIASKAIVKDGGGIRLPSKYKIRYVKGTMTVSLAATIDDVSPAGAYFYGVTGVDGTSFALLSNHITITGTNLGDMAASTVVTFRANATATVYTATKVSNDGSTLVVVLPTGVLADVGAVGISVTINGVQVATAGFTFSLPGYDWCSNDFHPFVVAPAIARGAVAGGSTFYVYGGPFNEAPTVSVGGNAAFVTSFDGNSATVIAPAGSGTGTVVVDIVVHGVSLAGSLPGAQPSKSFRYDP